MNAPDPDMPSDADVAKVRISREEELQRLALRDRLSIWRGAIAECFALSRGYAEMGEIAASLEDDFSLRHSVANFIAAAREVQSIYRDFRPKAPWETPNVQNEEAR
jgi:hypothetical protein